MKWVLAAIFVAIAAFVVVYLWRVIRLVIKSRKEKP